jgi:uncharacterized protein YacL (UPF0231 family)
MGMPFVCFADFIKEKAIRLHEDDLKCPLRVVDLFFQHYHLNQIRQKLQELLVIALSSDIAEMDSSEERNSLMLFIHQIEVLIEANYVMFKDHLPLDNTKDYYVKVKDSLKLKVVQDTE